MDGLDVVRRAKQGASCQAKDLMFQNLASRNYRVLQSCQLTHRKTAEDNRRSQRRSHTLKEFVEAWKRWEIPMPRVVEQPWPQTRQAAARTI